MQHYLLPIYKPKFKNMSDIYNLLAKHFLNETSNNEEKNIKEFKKNNYEEYQILKRLWEKGNISVKDFNTAKAWNLVQQQLRHRNKSKTILLRSRLGKIATAASVALIIGLSVFLVYQTSHIKTIIVQSAGYNTPFKLNLPDSSVIWLNKNTTVTYPEKFTDSIRNIKLSGEAFFKIKRNPEKPFVITTQNALIKVLGTSFNIKTTEKITKVDVTIGKVRVSNLKHSQYTDITKGYSAKVEHSKVTDFKSDNINYSAWRTGVFIFNNTKLCKAVKDLNSYYNNRFVLDDKTGIHCNLTAKFNKADITEVIEVIELTCDIKITEKNNKYIIRDN